MLVQILSSFDAKYIQDPMGALPLIINVAEHVDAAIDVSIASKAGRI
ncbi:MAG TPA: hypothetical protein V6C97_31595 [Oculatellaceae cyanobacterium]